jgi:hypothetical protein
MGVVYRINKQFVMINKCMVKLNVCD